MEEQSAPILAAIDVGSNTIHVVVARCFPDTLEIMADEVELVRIGESVTASGQISPEKSQAALSTLKAYQALAEQHKAEQVFVVATEAIRQANNSEDFIEQVRQETGLEIQVISGTAEAALTFLGATYGIGSHEQVGVMDLGGGSLELVYAKHMHIAWRTSVPLGSGWLHDHYLSADPPTSDEIKTASSFLSTYFHKMHLPHTAPTLIVTGGSANSLMRLVHRAFHRPHTHHQISQEDLKRCQGLLSALQAEDIANAYGQPLERARILLAGTLIIRHAMKRLAVQEIQVSPHGIREGMLLAYARYGKHWLKEVSREDQTGERFAQSAHKALVSRLHALLEWQDDVLKHEDIESVHKMRVATRRLRAALDAYQACCEPKRFAKVYRKIKQTADILGEARDTDVMHQYLCEQLESLDEEGQAGVGWLMMGLRTYRQQKQQELDAFLRKLDGEQLEHLLKSSLQEGVNK